MRIAAVLSAVAAVALLGGSASHAASTGNDWTRFGWNASRTSAPTFSTGITAAQLGSLQRQQVQLDGTVDASPIYLHGVTVHGATHDVFFVTTSYGKTEAIDASNGAILWRYTPPSYSSLVGSAQLTNSSPVADPSRTAIYAESPDGVVHKLSVADGHAIWSTSITKLASHEKMASPLNYWNGHVIATTGGYIGDPPPYQGHVAILDAASGKLLHVWNSLCSNRHGLIEPASCGASDSSIFGRAGAVVDQANGQILVATGNAPWDGRTNFGDAVIRLDPNATRMLGNWTPTNTEQLNVTDTDLGSTSPFILSEGYIGQGGKDGMIRVLSVKKMAGTAPHRGGELQSVFTPSGNDLFTAPAIWHRSNVTWVFAADNGGTAAWRFRNGRLSAAWRNKTGGTSPVVAGGLLWVYDPGGGLNVYAPFSGKLLHTLPAGAGHWNSPIVVDGRVALPEGNANDHATSGVLDIFRK